MEAAVKKKDVEPVDIAYLSDRVAVAEGRPQKYGTQFQGPKPMPIEDEARVDERRAALGLESMADYALELISKYAPPPPPSTADAGK